MHVVGGVETITVSGVDAGAEVAIADAATQVTLVRVVADGEGNVHVAFLPSEPTTIRGTDDQLAALRTGHPVPPGRYTVTGRPAGATEDSTEDVTVLGVDDHPDTTIYDQELVEGYQYLTVRDGVTLSTMVRFPPADLYGPPPYPTVVDYSGYTPSDPDEPQPGSLLATLLGFASVGVNMRGTGCSGGVFDVFSPAQAADGYDIVETVARQKWALHGKVGMVGLSYPGISQLYVAATRPPSLAAITPMSVIDDLWHQQWPGGVYNSGFTRAWLAARDMAIAKGGQSWDKARIEAGDTVAAANQAVRSQNFDFERFGRALDAFRDALSARRIADAVHRIDVPVYLTGAWQDEQTGSRFAGMLDSFDAAPVLRATLFNGHHPDGFSPMVVVRWYEFLSFFVAKRVPRVNELVRQFAPLQFQEVFGLDVPVEEDRFAEFGDDFDGALAAYLAEPPVRLMFENGAGSHVPGAASHRFETTAARFPPDGVTARRWYLAEDGHLVDEPPDEPGADSYVDDPDAGGLAYSMELLADLNRFTLPDVPIDWTHFEDRHAARYEVGPFDEPLVIAGHGHVELVLKPGTDDTAVQVTLTEIRSDGYEQRVQSGWHRPAHRVEDPERSDDLRVDYTYRDEHRTPLTPGEWIRFRVPIHPVAHVFRAGSTLRLQVSTPGRDHPFWCFDNPVTPDAEHHVGRGGDRASSLVLPVWDVELDIPDDPPAPGSLRGQPARPARPIRNAEGAAGG